jgi:hypothetical protein
MEDAPMLNHFLPEPLRISRRHLLKAAGVAMGALSVSLSKGARAQEDDGDHHHGDGGGDDDGGGGRYDCHRWRTCCFLRGTLIRGADGYRPIESLAVGEFLPTQFSGIAAIRKVIRFTVRRDEKGRWPEDCKLVCIKAGALDDGVPARDLFITHTHEVFLDQVLVPAVSLVNGKTIFFCDDIDSAEYFHVEFDSHDVIDAQGALCESSRDEAMARRAPVALNGGRELLWSHLRSAAAPFVDRRQPFDRIREGLEARARL